LHSAIKLIKLSEITNKSRTWGLSLGLISSPIAAIGVDIFYHLATALHNLQLGISNLDRVPRFHSFQPIKTVTELRDIREEVALDDFLDSGHITVLVENCGSFSRIYRGVVD
jgi:hypothetical protein